MKSSIETELVKQSKVKAAISELREEQIFESGAWIKTILDLLKMHSEPDEVVMALILLNRYYPDKLKASSKTDDDVITLFSQLSNDEHREKLFIIVLSFIILNEQKTLKGSREALQESRLKLERLVTLQWISFALEPLKIILPTKILIDLIVSLKQLPAQKHPILVFASYLLLNQIREPSWRIVRFSQDEEIKPYRLYYTIENDKLVYLQFNNEGDLKLKHVFSGDIYSPEEEPQRFIHELKESHHITDHCSFHRYEFIRSMLAFELPFTYSIFLDKCFSLPFWLDKQYERMIPEILETAKHWVMDGELLHYVLKLPRHQLTPDFFSQMITFTKEQSSGAEASACSSVDTKKICQWIQTTFLKSETTQAPMMDKEIEQLTVSEKKHADAFCSGLIQKNMFFKIYPSDIPGTSLSFIQEMKKESFFERPAV